MVGVQVKIEDVVAASGLDMRIIKFAIFNGYCFNPPSDLTLDEQVARIRKRHPEMSHKDALIMLGDDLKTDVQEFYNQAFPVVGRNVQ